VKIIRAIYSIYAATLFVTLFLMLMPFFLVPILFRGAHSWTGALNRIWARVFFFIMFMPLRVEYREKLKKGRQYIFCPNHNSYLDIAVMGLAPGKAHFVGKTGPDKVPLFGWMYRKLHITVNRNSLKSKYTTFMSAAKAIDEGKSLIIFPEGGIINDKAGTLSPLKEGAFRLAIEKQIPIVPVTIPNNWIILPLNLLMRWKPVRLIFHRPISAAGLKLSDMKGLKEQVKKTIEEELELISKNENR